MRPSNVFRARRSEASYTNSIGPEPTTTSASEVQMEEATQTRYDIPIQWFTLSIQSLISSRPNVTLSDDNVLHVRVELRARR